MPNKDTAMSDEELFTDNFGQWLQDNDVELDDLMDDGVWRCYLDMNKLKAAIMQLFAAQLQAAVREARREEAQSLDTWLFLNAKSDVVLTSEIKEYANDRLVELQKGDSMKKKFYLTDEQVTGLIKLVNEEIELNKQNEDNAYNTFWEDIKMALGYAITR